jgi:hypothetical protein
MGCRKTRSDSCRTSGQESRKRKNEAAIIWQGVGYIVRLCYGPTYGGRVKVDSRMELRIKLLEEKN